MKKNLTKVGNSWALLFTKTMIELLNADPEKDTLNLEFEGEVLKIKKLTKE